MTEQQLREMEKLLDDIVDAVAKLSRMLGEVKSPGSQTPSPFSGGGPGPK
jgi:hypothetical protein